jgi:hypothetical protein
LILSGFVIVNVDANANDINHPNLAFDLMIDERGAIGYWQQKLKGFSN